MRDKVPVGRRDDDGAASAPQFPLRPVLRGPVRVPAEVRAALVWRAKLTPDGNLLLRHGPRQPEREQASRPEKVKSGLWERRDEAVASRGQRGRANPAVQQSTKGSATELTASIYKAVGVRQLRDPRPAATARPWLRRGAARDSAPSTAAPRCRVSRAL